MGQCTNTFKEQGWVQLREMSEDVVLDSLLHLSPASWKRSTLKLLASKVTAELVVMLGIKEVIIEGDCTSVIAKLKSNDEDTSGTGPIIEETKTLLLLMGLISYIYFVSAIL
ncbi:hypothetical protein Salat_1901300 [Sesamum alatum]|uniref:RNase H type-1 domain-containing protein n=1 Tax=Sesamum alatum TaxID=300844 RepID=A0AAE2CIB3_9LAMI|nr:hypothetical protein Salat_1901300 [Sesamum alatum]